MCEPLATHPTLQFYYHSNPTVASLLRPVLQVRKQTQVTCPKWHRHSVIKPGFEHRL